MGITLKHPIKRSTWARPAAWLLALNVAGFPGSSAAQERSELPAALAERVEAAEEACAGFENGVFSLRHGAVRRVDLDGDLDSDWVLDEAGFVCSSAASLFCGSGGCLSHFLVDGHLASLLNQGWEVVTIGPHRTLLADVHGSLCGGINPTPCIVASTWDAEAATWRGAMPGWE